MAEPHDDIRVDDLRQRLRSLGYLDAGVDRFVLGAARDRRRPGAIASLASLRIGALAAMLVGPAAAIGIAARVPGLITGPRDGLVVALYLGAFFGVAVAVAALVAILAVSSLATRGARVRTTLAVTAGFVVAAASIAYLTLWWDASTWRTESGGLGRLVTPGALALVAAISLLIGHAVTVAALGVSVARGADGGQRTGVPGSSRRVLVTAGGLAFCGALLLVTLTSRHEAGAEAPSLTVVSSGLRVRLIAIDGFDPQIAARLAQADRIPGLAAALGFGTGRAATAPATANGPERTAGAAARAMVRFGDTQDPARLWTTVATGQSAERHAVRGLETRRVFGLQGAIAGESPSPLVAALSAATDLLRLTRPSIASRDERRVKAFWEVAAGAGLETVVVNWWASWPAPADSGTIISDRATLRLERGGPLDAEIAPEAAYTTLRSRWQEIRTQAASLASTVTSPAEMEPLIRRSAELDALQLAITRAVVQPNTDLACTYLPGLDLVQHGLLTNSEGAGLAPSMVATRLEALDRYYEFLDRLLTTWLERADDELLVILTSPGRIQADTPGLFVLRGAAVNRLARDAVATPPDIMPTLLHALGLPISRELEGRSLVELFSVEFARRYPVREVATYGTPSSNRSPRGAQPLDQEMIDRLRSLGYVR